MSKDKLKDFIIENRPYFDVLPPPKDGWSKVEEKLKTKEKTKSNNIKWIAFGSIAAMFILFIGIGIGYFINKDVTRARVGISEFESYYSHQLQVKYDALNAIHPIDNEVKDDLLQLERVYEELKSELTQNDEISSDVLVSKMIENYNFRIFLLEKVLQKTNKNIDNEQSLSM